MDHWRVCQQDRQRGRAIRNLCGHFFGRIIPRASCKSLCTYTPLTLAQVQLQTLTAVVKLYMKKPEAAQGLVQRVLNTATKDCDSPDVRDRAYIYWRLLSTDPGAAKEGFRSCNAYAVADISYRLLFLLIGHR